MVEVGVQTIPVEIIPIGYELLGTITESPDQSASNDWNEHTHIVCTIGEPPGLELPLRIRLARPARGTPEEVLRRSEDKHRRAKLLREAQDEQRLESVRQKENRVLAAKERRLQREQEKELEFAEKMNKASAQHEEQLRRVSLRARNENRKSAEVAFISKEVLKHEKEVLKHKQENARLLRTWRRQEMKKRLIQGAVRMARVAENRKQQLEIWQSKVQEQLEEKERLASMRRQEQQETLRLKSQERETRSEMARDKRISLQEEDEKLGRDAVLIRRKQLDRHVSVEGLPEGAKEEVVKQLQIVTETPQPSPVQRSRHSKSMLASRRVGSPLTSHYPEILRRELVEAALSDEEALQLASGGSVHDPSTSSRSRLSKQAEDFHRVLSFLDDQPCGSGSFDPDRADAILADFCKVLGQMQHERECALVLQLGCADVALDIGQHIRKLLLVHSSSPDRGRGEMHTAQSLSNVMLSVLKWYALLTKHRLARIFLLLTNRVVALVDIALACLDWQLNAEEAAARNPEAQSTSRLCLPQVLHMLSLHVDEESLPARHRDIHRKLVSYMLVSGLPEKLCDLFKEAEFRGMRIFEGGSLMPLMLLRAMSFLSALTEAYRLGGSPSCGGSSAIADKLDLQGTPPESQEKPQERMEARVASQVLATLRETELFGIVGILASMLLADGGRREREIPQTVLSLAIESMRILNTIACIDIALLQEILQTSGHFEFYHVLVCLLDYCAPRLPAGVSCRADKAPDESSELLHQTVTLLGYFCLGHADNQGIMWKLGEGQTLLARLTALPMHYFLQESSRLKLFPTILATCFRSTMNRELLRNEMNFSFLQKFLESHIAEQATTKQQIETEATPQSLAKRFPPELWEEALSFFSESDEALDRCTA